MKRQKTNAINTSILYLIPTPIGNFKDITYRAVELLNDVDCIFAEDTRVTKVLLIHFNIITPLQSYHVFNEKEQANTVLKLLQEGKNIALVSDAGMPGISDPGYYIVRKAIDEGFPVISIPGASAAITALVASGLTTNHYYFYGFLNHKNIQKQKELKSLIDIEHVLIFYESPHRIKDTLNEMFLVFGNREIVIARELTKKYEEYIRGKLQDIINEIDDIKGEIVIMVAGANVADKIKRLIELPVGDHYNYYLQLGNIPMEAIKMVAKDRNVSKSEIYDLIQKLKLN